MTITTTTSSVAYTCNGVTTAFAVPFAFFDTDELEVIERITSTGVENIKVLISDYAVTGGSGTTGTVTAVAAPAAGRTWTIRRVTGQTQETDLNTFGPLPSAAIELIADRLTAVVQEVVREAGRGVLVPKTEAGLTLPSSVDRASKFLSFDTSGNPVAVSALTTGALSVSAYVQTLLNAANSASFLAGLNTGRILVCTGGGTGNVQTLTPTTPVTSYVLGDVFIWLSPAANTGAVTGNVSGLGAKAFVRTDGAAMGNGDLAAFGLNVAVYDGTQLKSLIPTRNATFNTVGLDTNAFWYLNGGNPVLVVDSNDYQQYDRTTNRHEFYSASALAPVRVGRGAATDDSVRMDQGWHRLAVNTISGVVASTTFNLTSYLTAGFTRFRVEWKDLLPVTDAALLARFSTDAGATWKSGASDYVWATHSLNHTGGNSVGGGAASSIGISKSDAVESTSVGCNGHLQWTNRAAANNLCEYGLCFVSSAGATTRCSGTSQFAFASINGVQLLFNAVNLAAQGTVILYGSAE